MHLGRGWPGPFAEVCLQQCEEHDAHLPGESSSMIGAGIARRLRHRAKGHEARAPRERHLVRDVITLAAQVVEVAQQQATPIHRPFQRRVRFPSSCLLDLMCTGVRVHQRALQESVEVRIGSETLRCPIEVALQRLGLGFQLGGATTERRKDVTRRPGGGADTFCGARDRTKSA